MAEYTDEIAVAAAAISFLSLVVSGLTWWHQKRTRSREWRVQLAALRVQVSDILQEVEAEIERTPTIALTDLKLTTEQHIEFGFPQLIVDFLKEVKEAKRIVEVTESGLSKFDDNELETHIIRLSELSSKLRNPHESLSHIHKVVVRELLE